MFKLNSIIFPAPRSSYSDKTLKGKLIFLPRNALKQPINKKEEEKKSSFFSSWSSSSVETPRVSDRPPIPCLYIKEETQGSSKLMIYFHGNAEDLGYSSGDLQHLSHRF